LRRKLYDGGMTIKTPSTQLYLISPLDVSGDFPRRLERALAAGKGPKSQLVTAFQFRVKGVDSHEAAALAAPLQAICAAHDVAFIVNDSVALAKRLKADGVHLGQDDGSPRDAREELGREAQIGVTCHASRHMAMEAGEAGADYVAFGAFYRSTTKDVGKDRGPDAEVPDLELLQWWSSIFEIPCVAIGGITPENCAPLIAAGADFLAVSGAVWSGDEVAAVEAFAKAIAAAR
jgi:thiamine-phosphate pyrophosphorylase